MPHGKNHDWNQQKIDNRSTSPSQEQAKDREERRRGWEKKEGMSGYTDKVQPDGSQIIIRTITKFLGGAWQTNELCLIFYLSLNQK